MPELDYVVVLAGGLSPERDISLRSGSQLRDALSEAGVQVVVADADVGLLSRLRADPPSAVFPVIHGAPGEDGSVPEVLELLGVPYAGTLPPRPLPAVEIVAPSGAYDYTARYTAGQTEFHVPARLPAASLEEAARVALAAHVTLGLRDISRTDLIVDASGGVHFLEVNVAPGMTSTSTLPIAMRAAGMNLGACGLALPEQAVERAQGA
jgi:D-alanine-D-alanine ligase-like ATP-grasp enzyme